MLKRFSEELGTLIRSWKILCLDKHSSMLDLNLQKLDYKRGNCSGSSGYECAAAGSGAWCDAEMEARMCLITNEARLAVLSFIHFEITLQGYLKNHTATDFFLHIT